MEVAGVNKITLYENKGVSLLRSVTEPEKLISISNSGTVDTFDYCVDVGFESEVEVGLNYTQLKKDKIEFYIQDFNKANRQLIERFQNSKCGYRVRVKFESGLDLLMSDAMFFEETEKDFNKNSFVMTLSYKKQSELSYLDFAFENSLILTTTGGTVGITTVNTETQSVDWDDGSKENLINSVEATKIYPALPIRNYRIKLDNWKTTTLLIADNSNLQGSINSNIKDAVNLNHLRLHSNNLTGDLSPLSNSIKLSYLRLGSNNLSGDFSYISNLTKLGILFLERNNFTGSISHLDSLTELVYLYINNNNLTGADVSNLTKLQFFYLTNNSMSAVDTNLILSSLIAGALNNGGILDIRSGNTIDATGEGYILTLEAAGWVVT